MSLAAWVRRCPATTRMPVMRERRRADVRLEHRRLRFLHLQDQPVAARVVRALRTGRSSTGCPTLPTPTTSRATSTMRNRSNRSQIVVRQRLPVAVDHRGDVVHVVLGVVEVHDERRVLDEPDVVAVARGQLGDRAPVVLAPRLLDVALDRGRYFGGKCAMTSLDVRPRVPEVERAQRGGFGHVLPVRADCRGHDLVARVVARSPARRATTCRLRREPLDVPLPRARAASRRSR